jgi:hypothetical protein
MKNNSFVDNPSVKRQLTNREIDGRVILKYVLNAAHCYCVNWNGLKIANNGEFM